MIEEGPITGKDFSNYKGISFESIVQDMNNGGGIEYEQKRTRIFRKILDMEMWMMEEVKNMPVEYKEIIDNINYLRIKISILQYKLKRSNTKNKDNYILEKILKNTKKIREYKESLLEYDDVFLIDYLDRMDAIERMRDKYEHVTQVVNKVFMKLFGYKIKSRQTLKTYQLLDSSDFSGILDDSGGKFEKTSKVGVLISMMLKYWDIKEDPAKSKRDIQDEIEAHEKKVQGFLNKNFGACDVKVVNNIVERIRQQRKKKK